MSWYTLMHASSAEPRFEHGSLGSATAGAPVRAFIVPRPDARVHEPARSSLPPIRMPRATPSRLGTAVAGPAVSWTSAIAPRHTQAEPAASPAPSVPRQGGEIQQTFAAVARALGRSEEDLWLEAATEWLTRHLDDDPPPSAPASARMARPQRQRTWTEIDAVMADLRGTEQGEPAA